MQRNADDPIKRYPDKLREVLIAIKDGAVGRYCEGALGHGFHESAVRLVRALEGEHLLPVWSVDYERIF
jgi:hypothetical protein